jgi:hypothetical protein
MRVGQPMAAFPGNFTTGEGIFDKAKDSEVSSQGIEILPLSESLDEQPKDRSINKGKVKINPLF